MNDVNVGVLYWEDVLVDRNSVPMERKRTLFTNKPIYFHEFCSRLSPLLFFPCASHLHRALCCCHCSLCSSDTPRTKNSARVFLFSSYVLTCSLNIHGSYLFLYAHTHKSSSRTIERSGHWWIHGDENLFTTFFSLHSVVVSQFQRRCILSSVQHEKIYLFTALDKHNFLWLFS